jgi:hypothetical protein
VEEEIMAIVSVGIDLAKNVFAVILSRDKAHSGCDAINSGLVESNLFAAYGAGVDAVVR